MKTDHTFIKRYSVERNMWEVGYYVKSKFYIVRYEPYYETDVAS